MARRFALVAAAAATLVLHTDAQLVISTSRYVIDRWNLTFSLHSDEFLSVSAGAYDLYGDKIGCGWPVVPVAWGALGLHGRRDV